MSAQEHGKPTLEEARALLLARARSLGETGKEDAAIEALLEREVQPSEPTDEECRRYYGGHAAKFRAADLVEASHILFAMSPRVPPGALRAKAGQIHAAATKDPAAFEALARQWSNCPSAAQGGSLGQLGRGDAVPEFEAALFDGAALTGVLPALVTTRYGFHVVHVARRIAGRAVPFEEAHAGIRDFLRGRATETAIAAYVQSCRGS